MYFPETSEPPADWGLDNIHPWGWGPNNGTDTKLLNCLITDNVIIWQTQILTYFFTFKYSWNTVSRLEREKNRIINISGINLIRHVKMLKCSKEVIWFLNIIEETELYRRVKLQQQHWWAIMHSTVIWWDIVVVVTSHQPNSKFYWLTNTVIWFWFGRQQGRQHPLDAVDQTPQGVRRL